MACTGDVGRDRRPPATCPEVIKRKGRIGPGDEPGEVLFHEMVRAMRGMRAKRTGTTVLQDPHMDDKVRRETTDG